MEKSFKSTIKTIKKSPRVCLLDIETSPITAYTWGTYDQNVLKVLQPSQIISVAWKWLGEKTVHVKTIYDYSSYKNGIVNDVDLIKDVWKVLDEADVIIGHHSDSFDLKKLNARFVINGLNAPSFYETVDTKKVASRKFLFDSNSLNSLGQYLGVGQKVNNGGFDLWLRCIAGEKTAWDLMKKYNVMDVVLLEKVYLKLRSFMTNHPSLPLIANFDKSIECCQTCMSNNITRRGFSLTKTGRKQRYQCSDCGSWSVGPFKKEVSTSDA